MQILIDTALDSLDRIRAVLAALEGDAAAPAPAPSATESAILALAPAMPLSPSVFAGNGVPLPPSVATSTQGNVSVATPASVPVPPAAPPTASPSSTVDKAGLPWDARIHSESKNFTADGKWRKRRNLAEGVYEAVTAELMGAAAPTVPLPPPPPSVLAESPPVAPPPAPSVTLPPAPPAGPAVEPAPVPAGPAPGALTFRELMQRITSGIAAKKLANEQVPGICLQHGVPSLVGLMQMPDKMQQVSDYLRATHGV